MNVQREYNPRMFALLGEQPAPLSKRILGKLLLDYLKRSNLIVREGGTKYIQMNLETQELSGMEDERIYLFVDGIRCVYASGEDALQDFITNVYKKNKL